MMRIHGAWSGQLIAKTIGMKVGLGLWVAENCVSSYRAKQSASRLEIGPIANEAILFPA
jgi:hypothetical protein